MGVAENQFVVNLYYKYVDSRQWPEMFALFSDTIEYQRNDFLIKGKPTLQMYYTKDRALDGKHSLTQTYVVGEDTIVVEGTFNGTNAGKPAKFRFADFFFFKNGKIQNRHTYATTGA